MKYEVLVKEVMKRDVKRVNEDDGIDSAAKIMKQFKIGSVIVMANDKMKGILTTSDIVYKFVADKRGSKVRDIMSRDVITISQDETIEDAAKMMVKHNIEKLPVVQGQKLIGIITANDILKVEPALFEVLLERIKMGGVQKEDRPESGECERCGNYSDELKEEDGIWVCPECCE